MREISGSDSRIKRLKPAPAPKPKPPVDHGARVKKLEADLAMVLEEAKRMRTKYDELSKQERVLKVNIPTPAENAQTIEILNQATKWDFDIKRDHRGLIASIVATPREK